jgi:hypothetical protein
LDMNVYIHIEIQVYNGLKSLGPNITIRFNILGIIASYMYLALLEKEASVPGPNSHLYQVMNRYCHLGADVEGTLGSGSPSGTNVRLHSVRNAAVTYASSSIPYPFSFSFSSPFSFFSSLFYLLFFFNHSHNKIHTSHINTNIICTTNYNMDLIQPNHFHARFTSYNINLIQ